MSFQDLPERLRVAASNAGWSSLMPVQAQAIPYLAEGRDLIVQARTGSGKTGAFLLPMLERLDPTIPKPQALVLVPTRELARQVGEDAQTLCADSGLRHVEVYGGVGYKGQIDALREGAQIVIGTPGRVLDHLLKRSFSLENLTLLVFDEADRMLSMGFYPDMKQVQRYLPARGLQVCMFSATFPSYVLRTAREFIPKPEFLTLSRGNVHVTDIEHVFYEVPGLDKDRALVRLIELENPASAIIFCNTKARTHYVSVVLQRFGYDADELSSDLTQADRDRVLGRVRQGTLRFLVATDVAGRGIDIPELSHVFQYEPPDDPEQYVHRAGRTGRAGASGVAITLVNDLEKLALKRIAQRFHIELQERPLPTDEDVAAAVSERLTALLESKLRQRDKLQAERSQRFVPLARGLAESEDESELIAMLLDEYYQQSLHAPVAQPTGAPAAPRKAVKVEREKHSHDKPAHDKRGHEKHAAEKHAAEKHGHDKQGHEKSEHEKPAREKQRGRSARRDSAPQNGEATPAPLAVTPPTPINLPVSQAPESVPPAPATTSAPAAPAPTGPRIGKFKFGKPTG